MDEGGLQGKESATRTVKCAIRFSLCCRSSVGTRAPAVRAGGVKGEEEVGVCWGDGTAQSSLVHSSLYEEETSGCSSKS